MKYSEALEKVITNLEIKDENRLFLTIKNVYLDEMREGVKNVEYREDTEFFRRKLFVKGSNGKPSLEMKPLRYILFQGGYEPDSPRLLIELKGCTIDGKKFPEKLNTTGFEVDDYDICLLLGKIVFDSQNGILYKDLPAKKKPKKPGIETATTSKTVKPRKKKKTLDQKKDFRRSKIVGKSKRSTN